MWRIFKVTETFLNDREKTLEYYYQKKNGFAIIFPLVSQISYETLPHPENGFYFLLYS